MEVEAIIKSMNTEDVLLFLINSNSNRYHINDLFQNNFLKFVIFFLFMNIE